MRYGRLRFCFANRFPFQSILSLQVATYKKSKDDCADEISIHALRVESDRV